MKIMNEKVKLFEKEHLGKGGKLYYIQENELESQLRSLLQQEQKVLIHSMVIEQYPMIHNLVNEIPHCEIIDPTQINFEKWQELINNASMTITNAVALIAFSGTVVISSALDNSRLFSLRAPKNLVIAREGQMVNTMDEFFEIYMDDDSLKASNIVFVTGTSRTADIEKQLIYGVHGPQEFNVVLLKENT